MPQDPTMTTSLPQDSRPADLTGPQAAPPPGSRENDIRRQYVAARTAAVLTCSPPPGLIEVAGADRSAWLHNLLTNAVSDLAPGRAVFAFALNVKGRILFETLVLAREDSLWLMTDPRRVEVASRHLIRYVITERVELHDLSGQYACLGLAGPKASAVLADLGIVDAAAMPVPSWRQVECPQGSAMLIRHEGPAAENYQLLLAPALETPWQQALLEAGRPHGLIPAGPQALEVLRVEQGLPAWGRDIDENTLPAETGRMHAAVSFTKGCYLGQEIVERMRSRGGPARVLAGLRFSATRLVAPGTALIADGDPVGRVTSVVHSWRLGAEVGLGMIKTARAAPGTRLSLAFPTDGQAEVVALPMTGG